MGRVAESQQPLVVNDARDTDISLDLEKKMGLEPRTVLSIPLKRRGRLIGVLEAINHRGGNPFTEEDLSLAITLGEHIAIAVANARLFARAERAGLEYSLLAKANADLGKSFSLEGVIERIIKNLRKLIAFDAVAVFVLDRKKGLLVSKLHQGYPRGSREQIEQKKDEGVVSFVVQNKKGIIVDDVRENDMYINVRKSTRAEMVAPMLSRGSVIGAFNLESNRVRAYRQRDLELLEAFAGLAGAALERAHLYEERREKQEIEKELRVARTVQTFFIPAKARAIGPYRIAGDNHPSLEVSGDYYDFFPVGKSLVAFAIADVAGKGVPASLIMSGFRAILHTAAPHVTSAGQLVRRANDILLETVRQRDFVTAFIGVLNPRTGEVTYCNAGHNPPVLMNPDGSYRLLELGGPVLGVFSDYPMMEGRFCLRDETLLCYTDGATEARNGDDEEYGEERLIQSLREGIELSPGRLCRALFRPLKEHFGDLGQGDDITYLVLKHRK